MFRLEDSQVSQITTNQTSYTHFPNDEAGYTSASGNIFPLPNGFSTYIVSYGDGTNFSSSGGSSEALGVNVSLPSAPINGCKVVLYSTLHRNSSSQNECLRVNFPGDISIPDARRISALGVATPSSTGINIICPASGNHSKNHTYIFSEEDNVFVQHVDMN